MDILLILIGFALVSFAQFAVMNTYNKYSQVTTINGMTGYEVAEKILDAHDITDVVVQKGDSANLSDYYDPTKKIVRLSDKVYSENSIASVAVAAHEVGHAIQHHEGYSFIALRNRILPLAQIGSSLGWTVLIIGIVANLTGLFWVGLVLVAAIGLFQLFTLPIELDASSRAKKELVGLGIVDGEEISGVTSMLNSAAFTYIASFLSTVLQILRLLLMNNRRNNK